MVPMDVFAYFTARYGKAGNKYVKNGFYYGADLVYYQIVRADFPLSASNRVLRDNS